MAWMAAATKEKVDRWEFPAEATLVLDYPVGFAQEVLGLLEPPVVVVTGSESPYYLEHLKEFKPSALLIEPVLPEQLEAALRLAALGQGVAYPNLRDEAHLTPREHQVLRLLVHGLSDKEIARELGVEPKTVSHWMLSLRQKMGAENRAQAILMYWGTLPQQGR